MTEELLDIVDENNQPTGESQLRSVVHSTGLWHRTVHIYLFRERDLGLEILVHLRSATKDLFPNTWDTRFGGHIKSGMSIEESVADELKDELGLDADPILFVEGNWRKRDKHPNNEFTKVFYLQFDRDLSELRFTDDEVQEVKWKMADDIEKDMLENPDSWSGGVEGFWEVIETLKGKINN
jgi:isopentenyldiphosphate isomerase